MNNNILAVVAGHEITEDEITNIIKNYPQEQQMQLLSDSGRKDVLEQLIAFHLFAKLAEEEKIEESNEYKEMLEKITVELKSHMAATKTVEGVTLSEEEKKAFYDNHPEMFQAQAQVKAKHILMDSEDALKELQQKIQNKELSFEDAAKAHSNCPSKERGGDLGFFSKGQMVPEFEKAAFEGEIGVVLGPVKTQFGYHLIIVDEKKKQNQMTYDQVKDKLHEQLIQEKQKLIYDKKVSELEAKYGVVRN